MLYIDTNDVIYQMGPILHEVEDPSCTKADINQSTMSICGCGLLLPGTYRVQEFLLTQGGTLVLYVLNVHVYVSSYS